MPGFKEINDLGLDPSRQYAIYDQERTSSNIETANAIRAKTQVETTHSIFFPVSNTLFELENRNQPFGEIAPPDNFFFLQNRAFNYSVIPSIGSLEQISAIIDSLNKQKELSEATSEKTSEEADQLKAFFTLHYALEKDFIQIDNERRRLQKG